MGRILAIDYGQKRTGLAVTDEMKIIATALDTVATSCVLEYLKQYLESNPVECFVVGEPRRWSNEVSKAEQHIEPFIHRLQKAFPCTRITRMDERFTSLMASRIILESGVKKKQRRDKSLVDRISATLILQSYLESIQHPVNE